MKIEQKYKLEKMALPKGSDRDGLKNFALDLDGAGAAVAVATNGRAMAVVPVLVDDGDKVGAAFAALESLHYARRGTRRGEQVSMAAEGYLMEFPAWKNVVPKYDGIACVEIKFDLALLTQLADAMGGHVITLKCYDQRPGRAEKSVAQYGPAFQVRVEESPEAIGYIMPMRMD
jgi:hypothetical protein